MRFPDTHDICSRPASVLVTLDAFRSDETAEGVGDEEEAEEEAEENLIEGERVEEGCTEEDNEVQDARDAAITGCER